MLNQPSYFQASLLLTTCLLSSCPQPFFSTEKKWAFLAARAGLEFPPGFGQNFEFGLKIFEFSGEFRVRQRVHRSRSMFARDFLPSFNLCNLIYKKVRSLNFHLFCILLQQLGECLDCFFFILFSCHFDQWCHISHFGSDSVCFVFVLKGTRLVLRA